MRTCILLALVAISLGAVLSETQAAAIEQAQIVEVNDADAAADLLDVDAGVEHANEGDREARQYYGGYGGYRGGYGGYRGGYGGYRGGYYGGYRGGYYGGGGYYGRPYGRPYYGGYRPFGGIGIGFYG